MRSLIAPRTASGSRPVVAQILTFSLLALTLARLYEDYGGRVVGLSEYEAIGGMRRVVETEINAVLSPDPNTRRGELARLHDAFIPWLATVNSDTDQPMRRIARWSDLPENSHVLLNAFVSRRLLVKGERDDQVVVEVQIDLQRQLRHTENPVHRGADLMAHVGQELALGAAGHFGRFTGRRELLDQLSADAIMPSRKPS